MDKIVEIIRKLLVLCTYVIAIGIIATFGYTHKERVADQERRQGSFSHHSVLSWPHGEGEFPEAQITAIGCASTLVGGGLLHIIINWVFSIPLPWKKEED